MWTWIGVAGALGLIVFAISQMSSIAYTEDDIAVVNFSALNEKEKQNALEEANRARCACGCGMTLAQCVATDSTCPIRDGNVQRIEQMVKQAKGSIPNSF